MEAQEDVLVHLNQPTKMSGLVYWYDADTSKVSSGNIKAQLKEIQVENKETNSSSNRKTIPKISYGFISSLGDTVILVDRNDVNECILLNHHNF